MKWNWFMNNIRIKSKSMRKIIYILLSLCFLVACNEEDTLLLQKEGMGTLVLQGLKIESAVNDLQSRATLENVPTAGQFIVSVEDQATGVEYELGTGETQYALAAGTYKVKAQYGENIVSTDKPYYYGEADAVIEAGVQTTVTLTASLSSAIIRPVMDEQLLAQFKSYEIKVKTAEGTEYDVDNSEDLYVPSNKSYTLDFSGINQFDEEKSNTWTLSDLQARTRYLINCNADLPSFNFPMQVETNAWSKFIYITPMNENDITAHQDMADKILSNIVYEASADNNTWIPAEKKGDDWVITGLEPSTTYTLRSRFGGVISNNTQELVTESAQQVENGEMESWSRSELYGGNGTFSAAIYCDYCNGWNTRNERTTLGAESASGGLGGFIPINGNYGANWRWCSGTVSTDDKADGEYAAEISTLAFYNQKLNGSFDRDEVYSLTRDDGTAYVGYLFTGTFDKNSDSYSLGIEHNARPWSISFDYKYAPMPVSDQCIAYAKVYDNEHQEIASTINFTSSEQTVYKTETLYFTYNKSLTQKAAYIGIFFQSGTNTDIGNMRQVEGDYIPSPWNRDRVVGSVLKIDNVTLKYDYEN